MKLIHTADVHLGSKMDSRFPKEISETRKGELRSSFLRMVEYANANDVRAILLCGDVFDSDTPYQKDKHFFYDIVERFPHIDFLYLKGNHDSGSDGVSLPNLKRFSEEWTCYSYGDTEICGIELSEKNATSLYSTLTLNPEKRNLVLMHGQVGSTADKDTIHLKKLQGKHVDYLALGHVHKMQEGILDERGMYAYSGCLEGRGFDETGKHGFFLLDVDDKIHRTFVPFSTREIVEETVDITGLSSDYPIYKKICGQIAFQKSNLYRINLIGEVQSLSDTLESDLERNLEAHCFYCSVKDRTKKKLDVKEYESDVSLVGEFIRTVLAKEDWTEEEKSQIVRLGLTALKGDKIES